MMRTLHSAVGFHLLVSVVNIVSAANQFDSFKN